MVTGDNPDTAQEIACQIGLSDGSHNGHEHMMGPAFQKLDDKEAETASSQVKVLSRAKPLDKVRLLRSLQTQGEVVAVTGDGINDCGALNYADVGLAMGKTGKAAAKEASDIVLLDDSFRTIVDAVMWGRSLYQNIQRFILFAAIFLAVLIGLLLYIQGDGGVTKHELSVFFTVFVLLQFWNLFNARCLGLTQSAFHGLTQNPGFIAIAAAIFIGQVLIVQFGGYLFRVEPLSFMEWVVITAATSVVLWIGEIWRLFKRVRWVEPGWGGSVGHQLGGAS